jgi:hypothetical protein
LDNKQAVAAAPQQNRFASPPQPRQRFKHNRLHIAPFQRIHGGAMLDETLSRLIK